MKKWFSFDNATDGGSGGAGSANNTSGSATPGERSGAATNFQYNLFDKIIFSKIREKLGGQLKFVLLLKYYSPM
jgi:hypothetical protein